MAESTILSSLKLLGIEDELKKGKIRRSFDLNDSNLIKNPSIEQLQFLIWFLFFKLDPTESQNRFRLIYPASITQGQQIEFRNIVDTWMKQLKEKDADYQQLVTSFSRGTLLRANGPNFVRFVLQFSNFVLFKWLKQLDPNVSVDVVNRLALDWEESAFEPAETDICDPEEFEREASRVENEFQSTLDRSKSRLAEKEAELNSLIDQLKVQLNLDLSSCLSWQEKYSLIEMKMNKRHSEFAESKNKFELFCANNPELFREELRGEEWRSKPIENPNSSGLLDKWSETDKNLVIDVDGNFSFLKFIQLLRQKLQTLNAIMNEDKFKLNMEILKNSSNKLKSLVEEIQECERRLEKKTEEIKNMTAPHELELNKAILGEPMPEIQLYRPTNLVNHLSNGSIDPPEMIADCSTTSSLGILSLSLSELAEE